MMVVSSSFLVVSSFLLLGVIGAIISFNCYIYLVKIKQKIVKFSLFQQSITLFQSGNVIFQFDSTTELVCYGCDIYITDVTKFKTKITTQHQFDETFEYYILELIFK